MSETPEFTPGNVVELASGSPLMTVEDAGLYVNGTPYVRTVWFLEGMTVREDFVPQSLVLKAETSAADDGGFLT